jgi:lysylphosphatidylglycerol synthetase-like protein (DUF2156 family)
MLALGLVVVGVVDLVTAVLPPSRHQLSIVLQFAPLVVAQISAALLALAGLILLALSRGIRRGQRNAWAMACGVLVIAAVLHLSKGVEAFQSGLSLVVLALLVVHREFFSAGVERRSLRSGAALLIGGVVATVLVTTATVEAFLFADPDGTVLPLHQAFVGVSERMIGIQTVALPARLNRFLSPSLLGVGLSLAVVAILVLSRPIVDRRNRMNRPSQDRARRVIDLHGGGTLDYFALRHDKQHYFAGETLITYAVYGGVCLVSPDPIGPELDRAQAWAEFCSFAEDRGWVVAVLGADASWLRTYAQSGLRSLYIGDEAVVRLDAFSLDGGHKKGLRQAVNRIARYGYTATFHRAGELGEDLATQLQAIMEHNCRGDQERGFSMTLGRLSDPGDADVLVVVAHHPDGHPVAFCQFVPAPAIGGYSLDLMRRDDGDHPNGLIDFLVVNTIEHLLAAGYKGLGLNFATMRAVLAGESGDTALARMERRVLARLSRSMQIESLWRFTAKYDPEWVARYLAYGSLEHALSVGLAVARAESFWELPVIGRYLRPGSRPANHEFGSSNRRAA